MLERAVIDAAAATLDVGAADVERDYINGWLLAGIFQRPALAERLVLKGGNALRKGFFPNTRYSKDLDFSTPTAMDKELLKSELAAVCAFVTEKTGVNFVPERLEVLDNARVTAMLGGDLEVLQVRAYFLDFYGDAQVVPVRVFMDVTQFDKLHLDPVSRPLIHPYPDAAECATTIRCMALEEILASKLKCLLQRRHVADLYDYMRWVFFEDVPVDPAVVLNVFLHKTIYERAPGAAFELLLNLPLVALQEFWDRHLPSPAGCRFEFGKSIERFKSHLAELFGDRRAQVHHRLSFFPSALRDPIMSAGRNQHLMKITYDDVERTIEPYALKFKTKKDGDAGEYFYAWDLTGGRTSKPGLKTFVAENIQDLRETDDKFTPRTEIEVSKAGEMPDDPNFHGSGRPRSFVPGFGTTRPRRATPVRRTGPKYTFRCPSCNKTFRRATRDSDIRGHKDTYGNRCWGTRGAYEGYS